VTAEASTTRARSQGGGNGALNLARFGAGPLRYLDGLRSDTRDLVPFTLGKVRCHLVARPDLIKAVLESEEWPPLSRGRLMAIDKWYSGGLILTEGVEHHRKRDELWRPLVADPGILEIAIARGARRVEAWSDRTPVELFRELRSLCWSIDWEALTGEDLDRSPDLLAAQEQGAAALVWLIGPFGEARWGAPLPSSIRARAARRRLDGAIGRMIADRRAQGGAPTDLLARLVQSSVTDGVADDGLLVATIKQWLGANQLHCALTWALHLLATSPEVESRWHAELNGVLGGRSPSPGDVASLPYTRQVVKEAIRLYPPIWGFFRQVTSEFRLGNETIPAGDVLALSPWFTHRDSRLWANPLRFDPGRWSSGAVQPPAISYYPFSAGPYGCPAHELSSQEAVLLLATLGARLSFRSTSVGEPKLVATGTIVPKGGLRMTPVPRP
jgi:cytochrome P450